MSFPASAEALVVRVDNNNTPKLSKESVLVPKPGKHQLLVKVSHAAQNPTDGKVNSLRHWLQFPFPSFRHN